MGLFFLKAFNMKLKLYILVSVLVISNTLFSQKHDGVWIQGDPHWPYSNKYQWYSARNWVFSDTGMMIQNRPLTPLGRSIQAISSKEGVLQFYTNGNSIFSAADDVTMENCPNLNVGSFGEVDPSDVYPRAQPYMSYNVVPDPYEDNIYYMLHSYPLLVMISEDPWMYYFTSNKLQLTKIDMSQNKGKGRVVYDSKVISEVPTNAFIQYCQHANGKDWWVILKNVEGTKYTMLLLRKDSIIASVENPVPAFQPYAYNKLHDRNATTNSYAALSLDGSMLADKFGERVVRLFDFDRCSGTLALRDTLQVPIDSFHSPAFSSPLYGAGAFCRPLVFSPDGKYLYHCSYKGINQYETAPVPLSASKAFVFGPIPYVSTDDGITEDPIQKLRCSPVLTNSPNGKLYGSDSQAGGQNFVMRKPNEKGVAADFCYKQCLGAVYYSIPTWYANFRMGPLKGSPCDTIVSSTGDINNAKYAISVYPNPTVTDINIDITMPYYGADMQAEIMVSDLQGKVIYGDAIAPYSYKYTIEKGVLPSGVYLVSLKVKGKVVVSRKVSVSG